MTMDTEGFSGAAHAQIRAVRVRKDRIRFMGLRFRVQGSWFGVRVQTRIISIIEVI
jgi:hypothetical protein